MEKIKVLIISMITSLSMPAAAQHLGRAPFLHKGLMNIGVGLTPGIMVSQQIQSIYFNGNFAYCFEDQIAVRTDLNVFLPDYDFEGQLQKNSSILLGPEFHFPFGRFDISMLFESGLAFPYLENGVKDEKVQAEPVMNLSLNLYYFLFNNFHVTASAGYLHGSYFLESTDPFMLDELRFNVGIGINIFVNHQPAFQRKNVKF